MEGVNQGDWNLNLVGPNTGTASKALGELASLRNLLPRMALWELIVTQGGWGSPGMKAQEVGTGSSRKGEVTWINI